MASPTLRVHGRYCTHTESRGRSDRGNESAIAAVSGCVSSGWQKLVSRDLRGDAHAAVLGCFDAHNIPLASNVDVAGLRHLLRKRNDEVNLASDFEVGFCQEVQSPVADIPRVRVQLVPFRSARHYTQW